LKKKQHILFHRTFYNQKAGIVYLRENEDSVLRAVDMFQHLGQEFQFAARLDQGGAFVRIVGCSGSLL
jgi:hypothetical protein